MSLEAGLLHDDAQKLVRVYRTLLQAGISLDEAVECGWSKIEVVAPRIAVEGKDAVLPVVRQYGCEGLRQAVQEIQAAKRPGRPRPDSIESTHPESTHSETACSVPAPTEPPPHTEPSLHQTPAPIEPEAGPQLGGSAPTVQGQKSPQLSLKLPRPSWGRKTNDFFSSVLWISRPIHRALKLASSITGDSSNQSNIEYIAEFFLKSQGENLDSGDFGERYPDLSGRLPLPSYPATCSLPPTLCGTAPPPVAGVARTPVDASRRRHSRAGSRLPRTTTVSQEHDSPSLDSLRPDANLAQPPPSAGGPETRLA